MVYTETTNCFGIICYRSTRAYGIKEYYIKWVEQSKSAILYTDNYYLEREVDHWVKQYNNLVGHV